MLKKICRFTFSGDIFTEISSSFSQFENIYLIFFSHSHHDLLGRVKALIEDLGLAQVQHDRVGKLTASEKQRLNVACHLLLDADIVVLDEPTRGML